MDHHDGITCVFLSFNVMVIIFIKIFKRSKHRGSLYDVTPLIAWIIAIVQLFLQLFFKGAVTPSYICNCRAGLHSRHRSLNETFRKALVSADVPAILEPPGLSRQDGKRPDGLSLIPWSRGKSLLWDATCVHTLAKSYLCKTSKKAGSAAQLAEEGKVNDYHYLIDRYIFAPLGFESLGSWGPSAKKFISEVGKKIVESTKEKRSTEYLKQRISIDIQRGNSATILGTVPSSCSLDEIYYLISN